MIRLEETGHPIQGLVVHEDGAEESLFGFQIFGGLPVLGCIG